MPEFCRFGGSAGESVLPLLTLSMFGMDMADPADDGGAGPPTAAQGCGLGVSGLNGCETASRGLHGAELLAKPKRLN